MAGEPAVKTTLYKRCRPAWLLLPPVVPAVRKCHDASHKGCPGALAASFLWRFQAKWDIGSQEENASKPNGDLAGSDLIRTDQVP
jgi:hypothetical protein